MASSRFPPSQALSTGQIEQLRQFLQAASQIPSTDSIQEVLDLKSALSQPRVRGHSQNTAGTSGKSLTAGSRAGNFHGPDAAARPSRVLSTSRAVSSSVASSITRPVPDGFSGVKYPEPDLNSMLFDVATGYRLDQSTGLYYDANAGLFVNKQLNVLLKWNPVISSYTLVGRASDVATPALAQDLARLIGQGHITVAPPTLTPKPSTDPVRDAPSFRRERSLDFEEMSPEPEEGLSHPRTCISSGVKPSADHSVPDAGDVRMRRRSLSFDEMTPERDLDELSPVPVFPREHRSPSCDRRRDTSLSPRRDDAERRYRTDMRHSRDKDYNERRSPVRDRSGPRWEHSKSPRRNHLESQSPGPSRRRHSPAHRLKRRSSPDKRLSPRRGSRLSPPSSHLQSRKISREYNRERTPEREARKGSTRDTRKRISPGITRDAVAGRGDSGGRRFHRSPSPSHQFGRRQKSDYTERGQIYRESRRSRSRSPSSIMSSKSSRNSSRPKTNLNPQSKSSSHSTRSRSPLEVKRDRGAEAITDKSSLVDVSYDSEPEPPASRQKVNAPRERPRVVGEAAEAAAIPFVLGQTSFSRRLMSDSINRIYKTNLRNPRNTYGRLLPPHRVQTNFLMLTPLPHKGDREWDDLEVLLRRMLDAEGVSYVSVKVFPGDGGAPCNYCLIRFKQPEDAFRWYVAHEGTIDLSSPDGATCTVFMNFIQNNWKCQKCKEQNFALRHFCCKCFWYTNRSKNLPIQVSQLLTEYVGIAGLDCRFLSIKDVLVDFPPLDSFAIESVELLAEPTGIPVGLCVFKFKEHQESAAFYKFLQESCLNPIFVHIADRAGLGVNPVPGHLVKDMATNGVLSNPPVPAEETLAEGPAMEKVVFATPDEINSENDPSLWWRSVAGYAPEEGGDTMKYLFEKHPEVGITFESAPAQVLVGPLPIPLACDLMEYRDLVSRFLQSTGVDAKHTERTSICKAHHFGAPYNYGLLRFDAKRQAKEWLEKNGGKLVLHLENGSTWPAHLHYSKPNWLCPSCHKLNFPVRIQCFSCYKSRLSDHTPVTFKKNPTIFIGITGYQNWCATEELLFKKIPFLRGMKNVSVTYIREPTGVPLGICVLKSATPGASEVLFNKLQDALTNEIARASIQDPNRPLLVYIL